MKSGDENKEVPSSCLACDDDDVIAQPTAAAVTVTSETPSSELAAEILIQLDNTKQESESVKLETDCSSNRDDQFMFEVNEFDDWQNFEDGIDEVLKVRTSRSLQFSKLSTRVMNSCFEAVDGDYCETKSDRCIFCDHR